MAKRTLGLGKAAKQKKQKTEESSKAEKSESPAPKGNEIHVELDDEVDPDDELAQLKGLWDTYIQSDRDNEMVLNGIIHECDRLLRNQSENTVKLPAQFHSTYALALADLANFHTEDDDKTSVKQFFDASMERIELSEDSFPDSIELGFAKANVIFSRIPLEYISQWDVDTKKDDSTVNVSKLLKEGTDCYEKAESAVKQLKNYTLLDQNAFEALKALDDLLEIIRNFGQEDALAEGLDSDDEGGTEEQHVELSKKHPLYKVYNSEKYSQWLVEHGTEFADLVTHELKPLLKLTELTTKQTKQLTFFKQVSTNVGQLLLQAAEAPSNLYNQLCDDDEDETPIAQKALKEALKYTKKALVFFKNAEDDEDPKSWVNVAEAMMELGNLYDYQSKEQTDAYDAAEERLRRANNATNCKYQDILDDLLEDKA